MIFYDLKFIYYTLNTFHELSGKHINKLQVLVIIIFKGTFYWEIKNLYLRQGKVMNTNWFQSPWWVIVEEYINKV